MIETLTDKFLGRRIECECGTVHEIPNIKITIGRGALRAIPDIVKRLSLGEKTLLTVDERTLQAAGTAVMDILSAAGITVELLVLEGKDPEADMPRAELVRRKGAGSDFLVACGSGTINDLVKYAASRSEIPYVCVPTAPSMNGYTSSIVAIMDKGFKTTTTGAPPVAIAADTKVLINCPHEMVLAGLGDLLSKNVSGADWWLSHHVCGEYFCELPLKMVSETMPWAEAAAVDLANGDEQAIEALTEHLLVSGLSMTAVGMSRPSSGGEHLISHAWDMCNLSAGRDIKLHGVQVGVATVLTARLYEKLLAVNTIDTKSVGAAYRDRAELRKDILSYHGPLTPVVWEQFRAKAPSVERLESIANDWSTIRNSLKRYVAPAAQLEAILKAAGALLDPRELGMNSDEIRNSILHAREIRSRYSILDLAADLGLLDEFASEVVT